MEGEDRPGGFSGARRFSGPRPFRPSPVKVGEEYDVKIESLSRRGDSGVAKVQGLVVFVPNTSVGDAVRVRITKVGNGYATAEVAGQGEQMPQETDPDAAGGD